MKKSLLFLLAITLLASCQKSDRYFNSQNCQHEATEEEQQTTNPPAVMAKEGWGKNWKYVNEYNVTQTPVYNCYDKVEGDPVTVRQISTANGPRYAAAVAAYFNGSDWDDLFPDLANPAFAGDLAKLQSGDYFLEVKTNGAVNYLVVRKLTLPSAIHFVLAAEEVAI